MMDEIERTAPRITIQTKITIVREHEEMATKEPKCWKCDKALDDEYLCAGCNEYICDEPECGDANQLMPVGAHEVMLHFKVREA